ncbi:ribonuclease HII [Mycoplasma phocimorsus]|uniref:ribonuclease HII n=1 Tax=Mycoplasma phocimorsus TaxID=3045839 RepID=UPI0024C04577|nr:ribonuclease HII [Mycoplasma phocimorsus]MDJ1648405.1 ribonuclease HII [Mycoplasma phocimorsus]
MHNFEKELKQKFIVGCDEVGRGCCAGPLVASCVMLPYDFKNELINDSKKLSESNRKKLEEIIKKNAIEFYIEFIEPQIVDKLNPKASSKLAMKRCVEKFRNNIELVITDFEKIDINLKQINLIKGDEKSLNVAAASILAKVARDEYMKEIALTYPEYHFELHKGYNTKLHQIALEKFGVTPIHRLSYKNIKKTLN